jgi:hypothetical protein
MTTVLWGNVPSNEIPSQWSTLGMPEPERLLLLLAKERTITEQHYLTCPAFQDLYKNTFVVRSPIDLVITIDEHRNVSTDRHGQEFYDASITNRASAIGKNDPMLLSCNFQLLFVPDESCEIEIIPANMHTTDMLKNIRVIGGKFDAHKWTRMIDFAFEVLDETKPIVFKRNDPLFYVRFIPKNGSKVNLEHTVITEDMLQVVKAVVHLKYRVPRLSLEAMYKLAERLDKSIFFKKKKKCPFNIFNLRK